MKNASKIPCTSPPNGIVLDNGVVESFILADKPFPKALGIFENSLLVYQLITIHAEN